MAEMITCPHCKGTGTNYVIVTKDDKPSIDSVACVVCKGTGQVPLPEPEVEAEPADAAASAAAEAELWPILVPIGIFSLFFVFLWL